MYLLRVHSVHYHYDESNIYATYLLGRFIDSSQNTPYRQRSNVFSNFHFPISSFKKSLPFDDEIEVGHRMTRMSGQQTLMKKYSYGTSNLNYTVY